LLWEHFSQFNTPFSFLQILSKKIAKYCFMVYNIFIEVISKLIKSRPRHNLRPAKGAFPAVTATGSCRKLPFTGLWFCSLPLF